MKLFIYFLLSVEFILLVFMPEISFARYANEGREYDGAGGSGFGPLSYLAFYGAILYALYSLFTGSINEVSGLILIVMSIFFIMWVIT